MYVSPTGLGQVVPRGARAIRVPRLLHRHRGMGNGSPSPGGPCGFQTLQLPVGTFVDQGTGDVITGPPWCVINVSPACNGQGGLLASCSDPNAVPAIGFNPANYLPPITVCADGSQVGSGGCCPASVGLAVGQVPQPGCPGATAPAVAPATPSVVSPIATAPVAVIAPLQTVTEGGGSLPTTPATPATPVATVANCFSPFAQFGIPDPCLGPIGVTTLGAGIVAVLIVASMFGGRKR